jgi:predicted SprT family Zn-dependent metalloprotease
MKDTFGKKEYQCKCGVVQEEYVWSSQIREVQFECGKCGAWMGHESLKVKSKVGIISIRTPTKNR